MLILDLSDKEIDLFVQKLGIALSRQVFQTKVKDTVFKNPDAYLVLGDAVLPKPVPTTTRRRALPSISCGPMKIGLQVGFHED